MHPDAQLLQEVPLFQPLDETERADLAARLEVEEFSAGQAIIRYGDPGESADQRTLVQKAADWIAQLRS